MNHESYTQDAIKLFPRRDAVDKLNKEKLAMLPGPSHFYNFIDFFRGSHNLFHKYGQKGPNGALRYFENDSHRLAPRVELKVGAQVLLLVNLNLHIGLCNGSQGIIIGFEPHDPAKRPKKAPAGTTNGLLGEHAGLREAQIKLFAEKQTQGPNGHPGWPIVQFDMPQRGGRVQKYVRTIYPE